MKLAELLLKRSQITGAITERQGVFNLNLRKPEGDRPDEDPTVVNKEIEGLYKELLDLNIQISDTNHQKQLKRKPEESLTLSGALLTRENLKRQVTALEQSIVAASTDQSRYSRTEIKYVATVDVATLRQKLKELKTELADLDIAIQKRNWEVEV